MEEAIGAVKSYLRFLEQPEYLKDPMWAITRALRSVTPGDAQGFFRGSPIFYPPPNSLTCSRRLVLTRFVPYCSSSRTTDDSRGAACVRVAAR